MVSYLRIKKKINYKSLIDIYKKKKYLYIKLTILQKYIKKVTWSEICNGSIKFKKKHRFIIRKLKIKTSILNKPVNLNKTVIKSYWGNFWFYLRRVKRKKFKGKKRKQWLFYKKREIKNRYKINKPVTFRGVSLSKINKKNYSLLFFRKRSKKLFKNKVFKHTIRRFKYKMNLQLISSLHNVHSLRLSLSKLKKKPLQKIKSRNKRNFILFRKRGVFYLLRWAKKKYIGLFLQFISLYSANILKRKKFIKKINSAYTSGYKFGSNSKGFKYRGVINYKKIKNIKKKKMGIFKFHINYQNLKIKFIRKKKNIFNYLFLNKYSVRSFYIDFYAKSKKKKNLKDKKKNYVYLKKRYKKKKKIYYFNFWQKKLTTFKRARGVHWGAFLKKTIKKRRYKNFLSSYLKKNKNFTYIFNYFILTFRLSYIFWSSFTTLYIKFFNKHKANKKIYQLPISVFFWFFLKKHQAKKFKIKKRIRKWIAVKKRIKRRFWMKQKKKIPSFFSKQIYSANNVLNMIQFDYVTNYFCVLKPNTNTTILNKVISTNRLLKLHDFRYKS